MHLSSNLKFTQIVRFVVLKLSGKQAPYQHFLNSTIGPQSFFRQMKPEEKGLTACEKCFHPNFRTLMNVEKSEKPNGSSELFWSDSI